MIILIIILINFSVDVKGLTDLSFARRWSSPNHFGSRATFESKDRITSYLVVRDVKEGESGVYRYFDLVWFGYEITPTSPKG